MLLCTELFLETKTDIHQVSGVYRTSTEPDNFKNVGPVKAGQTIFVDIRDANLDESVFGANASAADFSRPASKAGIAGFVNQG